MYMLVTKNIVNHCNSQVVVVRALYSTAEDDRETMLCFFNFHDIREEPRKMQKLDVLKMDAAPSRQSV